MWYVMSHCGLDLWPHDLELLRHFGCHAFILYTKFERNRLTHGWVIDDLASFRVQFYGWVRTDKAFSGTWDAWTQLHQIRPGYRVIIAALQFYFRIRISCCIFKRGRLKVEWCFKHRQILHILTPVTLREGWARSLSQLLKLYLRLNLQNTFDDHLLRGC